MTDQILCDPHARSHGSSTDSTLRLVSWNIERGLRLSQVLDFLRHESPDICLLQEVDLNARRSGSTDIAQTIASELGLNYVFGVEWEELSQGSASRRAFQGQAILARGELRAPRILRFRTQTEYWDRRGFLPNWQVFQARKGGRMALTAELEVRGKRLVLYDVHLESKGADNLRMAQLTEVLHDSVRYPEDYAVVIAGDLNTRNSPSPLVHPLRAFHFQDACDARGCSSTKPNGQRLDWIFGRGPVVFTNTKAHKDVTASDHYPLSTDLTLGY